MKNTFGVKKNANKFIEEFTVINTTKQELLDEIVKKFYEKLEMINVIFDNAKRNEYLSKKSKTISEGTPEIVIQQKIGVRYARQQEHPDATFATLHVALQHKVGWIQKCTLYLADA